MPWPLNEARHKEGMLKRVSFEQMSVAILKELLVRAFQWLVRTAGQQAHLQHFVICEVYLGIKATCPRVLLIYCGLYKGSNRIRK